MPIIHIHVFVLDNASNTHKFNKKSRRREGGGGLQSAPRPRASDYNQHPNRGNYSQYTDKRPRARGYYNGNHMEEVGNFLFCNRKLVSEYQGVLTVLYFIVGISFACVSSNIECQNILILDDIRRINCIQTNPNLGYQKGFILAYPHSDGKCEFYVTHKLTILIYTFYIRLLSINISIIDKCFTF